MRLVGMLVVAALIGGAAYYLSRGPTSAVEPEVSAEALAAQAVVEVAVPETLSSRQQQGQDRSSRTALPVMG